MNSIKSVVDRIEEKKAVLRTDDGQTLLWSLEDLPPEVGEGSVVYIALHKDEEEKYHRENLAKDILNEIMNKE